MDFRKEIEEERKKKLGLDRADTYMVYQILKEYYEKKIIDAKRNIVGYTIDLVICNMYGFNRLGSLEKLNETWGDGNFYIDLNNSGMISDEVTEDGDIDTGDEDISFESVENLKMLSDVSFSIKGLIELCERDDFGIKLLFKDKEDYSSVIEIQPFKPFEKNDNINKYLATLK